MATAENGAAAPGDVGHRGEVLGMAAGGGLNLAGAVFNQAMRLAITLLLARLIDTEGVGLYFQAYAFLALLDLVALSGFKKALTRFVAVHLADDDAGSLRGTIRLGLAVPTVAAVVLGIALYACSELIANQAFGDPRLVFPLRVVAASLPATVFTDAALAATQGFRTMRPYALVGLVFEPACRIALTVLFLAAGRGLDGALVALLVTNLVAACLAGAWLRRLMGSASDAPRYSLRELFGFSMVSWVATLASAGLIWVDTILLGLLGTPSDVGVYQVATRLVLLATVFMQPLGASFAPRVADLFERDRRDSLQKVYALVTSWIVRLSLPAFVLLILFPAELLSVFGDSFSQGAPVTMLLALGQLFDVATGPCGHMLLMSGRPGLTLTCNLAGLALNVGLNVWLIPRYGIVGAALAWAASLALINVMRVAFVWGIMRMLPLERGLAKALPATAAAVAAGLAVRTTLDGVPALALGALGVVLSYVAVVLVLGLGPDDRFVLAMLRRRLRWRNA